MPLQGISSKLVSSSVVKTLFGRGSNLLHTTSSLTNMELKKVVSNLQVLAPTSLAESWDNVGLLIEPSTEKIVKVAFLTNDLTEPVLEEAIQASADLIISYHPPLFRPFKRLTSRSWKERIAVKCVENRIAVYSPHTSWDAIPGGINTWLLSPFGPGQCSPVSLSTSKGHPGNVSHTVSIQGVSVSTDQLAPLLAMSDINLSLDETALNIGCSQSKLSSVLSSLPASLQSHVRITQHCHPPIEDTGAGRILRLDTPLTLEDAVERTKQHLGMSHLRLAMAHGRDMTSKVVSIGVCAGSGGSVLAGVNVDLIITGEMSHHECLDFASGGVSVILADHSNTERGYLPVVKRKLETLLDGVNIVISSVDKDPLQII